MYSKYYSVFVIVIIIILYINSIRYQNKILHKLVNGFYEADTSFCNESGIDMFCIYFDEDVDMFGNRASYILAKKDNEVIINEPTVVNLKLQWRNINNWSKNISVPKYFNVNFKTISDDCIEIFPQRQEMRFYSAIGKLVLYAGDTITAVLYKNPVNTELKSILTEENNNDTYENDE